MRGNCGGGGPGAGDGDGLLSYPIAYFDVAGMPELEEPTIGRIPWPKCPDCEEDLRVHFAHGIKLLIRLNRLKDAKPAGELRALLAADRMALLCWSCGRLEAW